jgi:hypothetical protein
VAVRDPLGIAAGTTWHFTGSASRTDDTGAVIKQPLKWLTSVATVEEHNGRVIYHVIGWPSDAPDIPARATTVVVDDGVVHMSLDGEIDATTAWFTLPLEDGAEQCDADGVYCWIVEAAGKGWDISYRTGPDVTVYHLETGRGVTHYEYRHNGTADDVVLDRDPE